MARVVSEKMYTSGKLSKVKEEFIPEFAWLLPGALADGTFEWDAQLIWAQAYSYCRKGWTPERVSAALDEFLRVGLLRQAQDEEGKTWGFWVGSEKFLPSKERCKKKRYRIGRGDLFEGNSAAAPGQHQPSPAKVLVMDLDLDLDLEKERGVGVELDFGNVSDAPRDTNLNPPFSESTSDSKAAKIKSATKGKIKSASDWEKFCSSPSGIDFLARMGAAKRTP